MVSGMIRVSIVIIAALAGFSSQAITPAWSAEAEDRCRGERDQRLRALDAERASIETILDNDAAVSGAASFHLEEARKALVADIERQKAAVEARYRRCSAPPPTAQ
jgi:hypothetical protein